MNLTLVELHLPDAEFNAPFAGRTTTEDAEMDETAAASPGRLGPLVLLLALGGLAVFARYLRGSEPAQATLDDIEA